MFMFLQRQCSWQRALATLGPDLMTTDDDYTTVNEKDAVGDYDPEAGRPVVVCVCL